MHSRVNECSGKYLNFVSFPRILGCVRVCVRVHAHMSMHIQPHTNTLFNFSKDMSCPEKCLAVYD